MKTLKKIFYLVLLSSCLSSFAETIEIAAEDAAGPWGGKDGQGAGNEIVVAAFKAAGVTPKLLVSSYARAKTMTIEGSVAGCFSMAWEPELEGKVVFAKEPLYTPSAVFFKNKSNSFTAKAVSEIPEKTVVGTVIDYEYPEVVNSLKKRGIVFEEGYDEETNLKKLAQHRFPTAVAMVDELKSSDYLLQKVQLKDKVEVAFVASEQGSYVGFSLKHPQGKMAKAKFDQGYAIIKKNGTVARILKKWSNKQK